MTNLIDIERELRLFTIGITGKTTRIHASNEESGRTLDSLDSTKLSLPPTIESFGVAEKDKNLYLLLAMEQVAFAEIDTLEFNF